MLVFIFFTVQVIALENYDLTDQEKEYLKKKQSFNVCTRYDHYPLSGAENGNLTGISGDIFALISKKLGVSFQAVEPHSQEEFLSNVKSNKCELIASIKKDFTKFNNIKTTDTPIIIQNFVLIGNISHPYIQNISKLNEDKKKHTIYVKELIHKNLIETKYPYLDIVLEHNVDKIMDKLSKDKHSFFMNISYPANFIIQSYGVEKFKIVGKLEQLEAIGAIGVNTNEPMLLNILNKTLDDIGERKFEQIASKYEIKEYTIVSYQWLWYVVVLMVLFGFIVQYLYLKQIKKSMEKDRLKTQEIEFLNANLSTQAIELEDTYAREHTLNQELNDYKNHLEEKVKEQTKTIQASQEKYYNLMSLGSEGVFIMCPKTGQLLEHSKIVNTLLGYCDEELEQLNVLDWDKNLQTIEEYQDMISQIDYDKPMEFETIHTRKDGSTYIASVSSIKIISNNEEFIYATARDVTTNKQLINDLALYKQIVENTISGVSVADATKEDMPLIYVNKTFEKFTGYSFDEVVNTNCRFLQGEDREQDGRFEIAKAIKEQRSSHVELRNYKKDGTLFWNLLNISPIFNQDGELQYYVGMQNDITEIKTLNEKLQSEKQKAEQANQTKSIFLSTMSHEIRTPLNAILGFIDLLKDKNLSTEQKEEYINIIDTSSHNLLDIINDILDLSKIESGNMELDTIVFSPKKALEDVKKLFQAKAYEKDIKLTTNKDEAFNDLFVHGDITKLKQIISNLLGNAIKFTPKNGFITTHLNIVSQDDDKVVLRYIIQDSGIGIDQDKLSSIFEPFKQEDETTTRKFGGTGLGLSIVKNMIELMGGNIEVASQKGEGAAFIVTLPFAIADVKDEELEEEIIHNYQYFGTVLVVDDVAINRKLLDIKLEKKGLDYIDASNGLEATQIFQKEYESISLIYLDINMPIMDGVEAVKIIKKFQEENNLNIPVIALTADAMQGMREKYLAYGFDDYLVKPIDDMAFELSLEKYLADNIKDDVTTGEVEIKVEESENYSIEDLAHKLSIPVELYAELLEEYIETTKKDLKVLNEAIKEDDMETIHDASHKLKGISGNMRLNKMYNYFTLIEEGRENAQEILLKVEEEFNKIEKI